MTGLIPFHWPAHRHMICNCCPSSREKAIFSEEVVILFWPLRHIR
jgi:hypothetical protein